MINLNFRQLLIPIVPHNSCYCYNGNNHFNMATEEETNPKNDTIGLAISGGILVAATGGAAVMRGFQQQIIQVDGEERPAMEAFDFISGLSGGCIPVVLYSYAQNVTTNELLDADFPNKCPSKITPQDLERKNEKSLFEGSVRTTTLRCIPALVYGFLTFKLHKFWTIGTYFSHLKQYGIKRRMRISSDEKSNQEEGFIGPRPGIKAIPLINFVAKGEADDRGRDSIDDYYKVIGKLNERYANNFVPPDKLLELINEVDDPDLFIPYIASPDDVRNAMPLKGSKYLNTINVNKIDIRKWSGLDHICSIEFFLGVATNFLGMGGIVKDKTTVTKILSKLSQQRMVRLGDGESKKKMLFVDGGCVEGLAIPALVQRKVRKIVASIWPHAHTRGYNEHYESAKGNGIDVWLKNAKSLAFGDIASYFGYYSREIECFFKNCMFEDGEARLEQLRNDVDTLYEAGKPIVVTMKDLKTIRNPFWGIEAGHTIDLTIIYWTLPKEFADKIPIECVPPGKDSTGNQLPKCDEDGLFNNKEFHKFPNLDGLTNYESGNTLWNYIRTGALTRRQANMFAYLGSWVVNEAWEGLSVDGKQIFGGFKEILQKE